MFREIWTELCLNKLSNWQWLRMKVLACTYTQKTHKSNWQNSGRREVLNYRGNGTRREALQGERQDCVILGVATLDRSPDQSPGVRPLFPSH